MGSRWPRLCTLLAACWLVAAAPAAAAPLDKDFNRLSPLSVSRWAAVRRGSALRKRLAFSRAPRQQLPKQPPRLFSAPARRRSSLEPYHGLKIMIALEGSCQQRAPSLQRELDCLHALFRRCAATSPFACFVGAAANATECRGVMPRKAGKVRRTPAVGR